MEELKKDRFQSSRSKDR